MKAILTVLVLLSGILLPVLTIGYYTHHEDEEIKLTLFVKKTPTLQTRFHNIFATEGDDKTLKRLRRDERKKVIDYCRYRLGIETRLRSNAELDSCKAR